MILFVYFKEISMCMKIIFLISLFYIASYILNFWNGVGLNFFTFILMVMQKHWKEEVWPLDDKLLWLHCRVQG